MGERLLFFKGTWDLGHGKKQKQVGLAREAFWESPQFDKATWGQHCGTVCFVSYEPIYFDQHPMHFLARGVLKSRAIQMRICSRSGPVGPLKWMYFAAGEQGPLQGERRNLSVKGMAFSVGELCHLLPLRHQSGCISWEVGSRPKCLPVIFLGGPGEVQLMFC